MSRVFFRKVNPGEALVSGVLIQQAQTALNAALGRHTVTDGIFGSGSRDLVTAFQTSVGLAVNGELDADTWKALMHSDEPPIFERCLQITAHFEGTGFTRIVGNFDGAGLTWGIIGFTLSNGELGAIVQAAATRYPARFNQAFGSDGPVLLQKLALPSDQRMAWANSISRGAKKYDVAEPWRTYFKTLGEFPEIQQLQIDRARDVYWKAARRDALIFGLTEELDFALFYDIAVQNGSMASKGRTPKAKDRITASADQSNAAKRDIIIDVVVETSTAKYQQDVRSRKTTLKAGAGLVHGAQYDLDDWGFKQGVQPLSY
jgi:peptidoglycan hydrolase-like protein with peptidoglycan-binding domain